MPSGTLDQLQSSLFLGYLSLRKVFRAISTGQLRTSPPLHFLPINVVVSHDPIGKSHLGSTSFEKDYKRPKPEDEIQGGLYGKIEL